jgi:hypothetical protein
MKFDQKEWAKIIGYFIPIIALVIGNILQIENTEEIQAQITQIVTIGLSLVAGVIGFIGVIKSHDKKEK